MKINILGCHGGTAPGYRTTCYQVNSGFLIDAGSVCSALSPQAQMKITDILITHPHIDHIKDLAFLIENTFHPNRAPLRLRSTEAILNDIHKHLFNNVLWPDFSTISILPNQFSPLMYFETLTGTEVIDDVKITSFRANHPGNAVGFLLDENGKQVIFSGDTGPNDILWEIANQCSNLQAVFTEISFPNRMDGLAKVSGHFTLKHLIADTKKLKKEVPIYISHFKPLFFEELMEEFHRESNENMVLLHQDDELNF